MAGKGSQREARMPKQKEPSGKNSRRVPAKKQIEKNAAGKKRGVLVSVGNKAENLPVVGIGASAGGLEAIEGFFANTPSEIRIACPV